MDTCTTSHPACPPADAAPAPRWLCAAGLILAAAIVLVCTLGTMADVLTQLSRAVGPFDAHLVEELLAADRGN